MSQEDRGAETDHLEGESREIADWVIACQRAGWEDLDFETYLSQFAEDATVVLARMEEQGEYDVTYDYDTIIATRAMRMRGENPGTVLWYLDIAVDIEGDKAIMTTRTIAGSHESEYREIMNERFTLRRGGDGWQVVEDRAWLVGELKDGQRIVYNERTWRTLDRIIERDRTTRDERWLRYALHKAYRLVDSHTQSIVVCELSDATADDWAWRGLLAVIAGDTEDATFAFETARDINPEVFLPYYAVPRAEDTDEEEEND